MKIEYHCRLDTHHELLPVNMESLYPIIRRRINTINTSGIYDVEFNKMFPDESPDKILTSTEMLGLLACLAGRSGVSDCIALVQGIRADERAAELKDYIGELIGSHTSQVDIPVPDSAENNSTDTTTSTCTVEVPAQTYDDWLTENQAGIFEWANSWYVNDEVYAPFGYIAWNGLIDIIKIAPIDGHTLKMSIKAAAAGQMEVITWLHEQGHPCDYVGMAEIACNNYHLSVVKFLDRIQTADGQIYIWPRAYRSAAVQQNLEILEWAVQNNKLSAGDMKYLMTGSMKYGSIKSVKYLHGLGVAISEEDVIKAATGGYRSVVQYACIRHVTINIGRLLDAADGHPKLTKWIHRMYTVKPSTETSVVNPRR